MSLLGRLYEGNKLLIYIDIDRSQAGDQICQKASEIIVVFIEGEPAAGKFALMNPLTHEGRFSKAGRCRNQDKLSSQTSVEVFDQVWARNKTRAERGRVELCGENPSRHDQELPRLSIPYETMIIASQPSVFQSPRFVNRTAPESDRQGENEV